MVRLKKKQRRLNNEFALLENDPDFHLLSNDVKYDYDCCLFHNPYKTRKDIRYYVEEIYKAMIVRSLLSDIEMSKELERKLVIVRKFNEALEVKGDMDYNALQELENLFDKEFNRKDGIELIDLPTPKSIGWREAMLRALYP